MSRAFMIKQASFKPTDIGGCQLWLDASDTATISLSGSTVTQINDKSGNSNNTSSSTGTVTYAAGGLNSRPAFSFNATGGFRGPISITGTTLTTFTVATLNSGVNYNGRLLGLANATQSDYEYATTGQPFFCLNGGPNISGYRNNTYMSYQTNTFDTPFIGTSQFTGSSNITSINGTPGTAVADANGSFSITKYGFGCEGLSDAGVNWYGYCSEMILYNSLLSTPQQQQVEAYLAQKWGLQANLPQGHPGTRGIVYSSQPIPTAIYWRYQSAFVPTSIGGCQIWLDAADSATFTLNGSTVSTWMDKTGNGFNVSQASAGSQPTRGSNEVVFNGSTSLQYSGSVGIFGNSYTSYVIHTPTNNTSYQQGVISIKDSTTGFDFEIGQFYVWNSGGSIYYQFTASVNSKTILGITSTTSLALNYSINGAPFSTGGAGWYGVSSGSLLLIGNSQYSATGFIGTINEYLLFTRTLTATEHNQITGYLAWKWGSQSSLPANHPYKNSAPIGTTNPAGISRPANVLPIPPITLYASTKPVIQVLISSGLLARYRMNESSGSTVIDSIAGNNITIGGSPSRVSTSYGTYTGYALSIQNATQYGSITLPANMVVGAHSITSWVYLTGFASTGVQCTWVGWGVQCTGENHVAYKNGSVMTLFGGASCIASLNFLDNNTNTVAAQLNTWYFCVTTWDGTNTWKTYCYSPTTAYNFTYSYGMNAVTSGGVFAIGCANGLNNNFAGSGYGGYIGEVRFYNRVLTAGEVASIYAGTG